MLEALPRGAIPSPRSKLAAAAPHVPVGASPTQFIRLPANLDTWGNPPYQACATAEEAFAKACADPRTYISSDEVVNWATQYGFLNTAVISDVLEAMASKGFEQDGHQYHDGPHFSVDWTNAALLQSAIAQGPVKLGVSGDQLNSVYTAGANGWCAVGFANDGSAEDHCVSLCGYGTLNWLAGQMGVGLPEGVDGTQPGYAVFSWGTVGVIDVPSMIAIAFEAWVRTPTTIVA
jgi:hypothetical protein